MSHRNRYVGSATAGLAFALALVLAPRADAGQHGTAPTGPRGSSSGHVSSGHSSSHSPSHIGGRSEGHSGSRGPVRTSPVSPRSSGHDGWSGGGGRSWGGHSWGGHSSWGGRRYPHWYRNWYWGFTPYWASYGWLWGWPWYYDPFFSDWRYVQNYGYGPYDGDVYAWRSGHGGWAGRFGRVKTDVEPDEAEVWLNGKYVGTADDFDGFPDYLYLEPGSYKLEFRLPGYQTWTADASPGRGELIRLKHHLDRDKGKGRLDSFLPASKGMPQGRFFGKDGEPVAPDAGRGRYRDRDRKRGDDDDAPMGVDDRGRSRGDARPEMDDDDADAAPAPEEKAEPAERMPARESAERRGADARGRIRWNVQPEDAAVWVDDAYVGTADELSSRPRGTYIAPGKHSVTVVRPGYKSRTVEVEAKGGEAVDVTVELEK